MASPIPRVTVGWIAPMALELAPVIALLENYTKIPIDGDETMYHVGKIWDHWVVAAVCPMIGTNPAAILATNIHRSFPNVKHLLVVGIAGGTPAYGLNLQEQVVLGDVVVGYPQWTEGGVAQHDFGAVQEGKFTHSGHLLHPSSALLTAVNNLKAQHYQKQGISIPGILQELRQKLSETEKGQFEYPGEESDYLFSKDYRHKDDNKLCEEDCDPNERHTRRDRGDAAKRLPDLPRIHYGTICSGNSLVISTKERNHLYERFRSIAYEMESAGVLVNYQALVIRGICDYADSHKNKKWQGYAAMTAAAYAKELLSVLPPTNISPNPPEVSTELSEVTRDCMKSLAFERMLDRSNDVERAAPGTCEWLLRHQQYNAWTTAPGDLGLLWIKGKPGSGKSTLLKHALSQVIPQEKDLVLQFFFHGRGDPLQKSLLGFFRSILHQILRISPQAIPQLISMFEKNQRDIGDVGKKWDWHINHLKHFVESSLPKLLETYTIWLYVDALDECGEDNAVELFDWLQNQSQSAHLRVFITCRHYPILDPDCTVFQICSEDENENDISSYIQRQFSKSPTLMKSQIPDMIARRARGVFMWAHLVVKKAKDLARQRLPLQRIEKEISRTPAELDDLYNDLIADMDDESLKLIRWVCFAEHPFTLDVMRWALAIDPESDYRSLKEYQDQGMVYELEDMETQVMRLSRGLAEVASFKSKYGVLSRGTGIVQFIHQSVKDYFLGQGLLKLDKTSTVADRAVGEAHHQLSRICIRSLAMEDPDILTIRWDDAVSFFEYAILNWIKHCVHCEAKGIEHKDLLELFHWPSNRIIQRWAEHVEEIEDDIVETPISTKLIQILSGYGLLHSLTRGLAQMPTAISEIHGKDSYGQTPISLAARGGHEAVVQLFLATYGVDINIKNSDGRTQSPGQLEVAMKLPSGYF